MGAKNDINKMIKKLAEMRDSVTDKKDMLAIGKEAVRLIKKRTRLGFGVADHNQKKQKLKKLSHSYKKTRKKHKPKGPSTPAKSNLTYTGKMLNDIEAKKGKSGSVEIGFKTTESRKKAGYVSKERPFNFISSSEFKQLRIFIQDMIDKVTKK